MSLERLSGRHWYDGRTQFFETAAAADDAVIVWLD